LARAAGLFQEEAVRQYVGRIAWRHKIKRSGDFNSIIGDDLEQMRGILEIDFSENLAEEV
jgi:hypothetical protein